MSPCPCAFGTCMDQVRMLDLSAYGFVDAWKPSATPVSGGNGAEMFCTPGSSDDRGHRAQCMQGRRSSHVGAQAEVAGDGVQDVAVARGLLPDVQLHHGQPKALHLHTEGQQTSQT